MGFADWGRKIFDPGNIFTKQGNPSDAAMPYLNKIPGVLNDTYGDYMKQGQAEYPQLSSEYNSMGSDPAAYLESIMKNYKPSAGYQFKQDQMLKAAGNSAAAGGTRGSINDIQNEGHLTDMLMGDDMQNWLNNVLGIQQQGMGGQQHLYDTGYGATQNYASDLSNLYGTQAQSAYNGVASRNAANQDFLSGLFGTAGGVIGSIYGGSAGGKAGKIAGNNLGRTAGSGT
jgi:hypothetical protein